MTTLPSAAPITPEMIRPFMNSVRQVFTKMVGVEATTQKPFIKAQPSASHDVCGIIGLSGEIVGSVVVSFSREAAEKLVECFAGQRMSITDANFADAIGELANMIAGSAKQHLGAAANISVPSVVIGKDCTVAALSDIPCVVIPCTSPHGNFAVEIALKRKK